ncbi:MAG: glycosyl transferase [Coriobacteriaceae bacterium]|nr:MAG: glycosyl transferase [Coriobacteriaceae bacterium]
MQKVIHYCWFGRNPLGEKELACIGSWSKFFPDYEIRRWDETNFDVRCCNYVSEAYDAKKWAFVSDYARFKILYENGGLYFDTDVEVIRPFEDVLEHGPFMGFEVDPKPGMPMNNTVEDCLAVNPGLGLAADSGNRLYREVLESYESDHFLNQDGTLNFQTVVERVTAILLHEGLESKAGIQHVVGVTIWPSAYFNPMNLETGRLEITDKTHSIHHYDASWQSDSMRYVGIAKQNLSRNAPWLPAKLRSAIAWASYLLRTGDFKAFQERL